MYGYQTSLFALRDRAELQPGETLLVLGAAGGVGEWCSMYSSDPDPFNL
jgi:NADPH:quinone reductase-like Zn-dependent oxidoreductase